MSVKKVTVRSGWLLVHEKGFFLTKLKKQYFLLFARGPEGPARLEVYDDERQANVGIPNIAIKSDDLIKADKHSLSTNNLNSLSKKNGTKDEVFSFMVYTNTTNLIMSSPDGAADGKTWLSTIQRTLICDDGGTHRIGMKPPPPQLPISKKPTCTINTNVSPPNCPPKTEFSQNEFKVKLAPDTVLKVGDNGIVRMIIDDGNIILISENSSRLGRWPISKLRKTNFSSDEFNFVAGRNTEHGEGIFNFITTEGRAINHAVRIEKNILHDYPNRCLTPGVVHENLTPKQLLDHKQLPNSFYNDITEVFNMKSDKYKKGMSEGSTGVGIINQPPALSADLYEEITEPSEAWRTNGYDEAGYYSIDDLQPKHIPSFPIHIPIPPRNDGASSDKHGPGLHPYGMSSLPRGITTYNQESNYDSTWESTQRPPSFQGSGTKVKQIVNFGSKSPKTVPRFKHLNDQNTINTDTNIVPKKSLETVKRYSTDSVIPVEYAFISKPGTATRVISDCSDLYSTVHK